MLLVFIDILLAILLVVLAFKSFLEWVNPCFKKVSKERYDKDMLKCGWSNYMDIDSIPIPTAKTSRSAGHDFISPTDVELKPGEHRIIPTGLRCRMNADEVMLILPRSSVGIKQGVMLRNTAGVIDADYYEADNEGHIMICLKNTSDETVIIPKGSAFAQGIVTYFVKMRGASLKAKRRGGFGSTGK